VAIDTEDKRRSVIGCDFYPEIVYPVADGAIASPDFQHVGWIYRGIVLAGAQPEVSEAGKEIPVTNPMGGLPVVAPVQPPSNTAGDE
jgi:hypothetical protein